MANYKQTPSLGFMEACKLASSRLTDFNGRSRRSEFWWWMLIVILVNQIFSLFMSNLLVAAIFSIVIMAFGLAVTVRRVQDTGKSAIWVYASYGLGIVYSLYSGLSDSMQEFMEMLQGGEVDALSSFIDGHAGDLAVISGISTLWMIASLVVIVFCLLDGNPETNKYGKSPKYIEQE